MKRMHQLRVIGQEGCASRLIAVVALVCGLAVGSRPSFAQVTVFSDTFGSSTLNGVSSPTANSTSYDIASSKAAGSAIGSGDLSILLPSTSSGLVEAQALFASTPIMLSNPGDYIQLTYTFTDSSNILISGKSSSQLWVGLFDSYTSAPLTNLQNSGLSTNAAGGTQGWQGYHIQLPGSGNTAKTYFRATQTAAAGDQDLLGNNASSGSTYANPRGYQLSGQGSSTLVLTNGQQLTEEFKVMLNASGGTTVSNILIDASSSAILFSLASTTNSVPVNAFDGLAFGWLYKGSSGDPGSAMDVSSLTVITNVPEPSTIMLALSGLGLVVAVRRFRKGPAA
ncbi:MAG TPA: PEP-CTERM sorting domain-containing protein [Verrucomicrobiae bacterium]|nr:PEP-CTERM sorting domain-containing protein [Verrucomicrobiae bacterium]